jgi:hypothetical protein
MLGGGSGARTHQLIRPSVLLVSHLLVLVGGTLLPHPTARHGNETCIGLVWNNSDWTSNCPYTSYWRIDSSSAMTRLVTILELHSGGLRYTTSTLSSALGRRIDKMTLMGKHYTPVNGVKA